MKTISKQSSLHQRISWCTMAWFNTLTDQKMNLAYTYDLMMLYSSIAQQSSSLCSKGD